MALRVRHATQTAVPDDAVPGELGPTQWNEDHTITGAVADTVQVIAGAGLTGGGTLSSDVTLNIGAGTGITVNADDVAITATGVTATTYGSATQAPQIAVNTQGQITSASSVTVTPDLASITGLAAGIAAFLGAPSSANILAAVTDETGTGALVFGTSPTLVTPNIGAATGSTLSLTNVAAALQLRICSNANPPASQASPQAIVHSIGPDGQTAPWQFDTFFGATSFICRRANGTGAAPTTLLAGDAIMNFTARGYDGTAYSAAGTGTALEVDVTETWSPTAHGATWHFRAVQNGTTATQDIGWWHAGLHVGPTQNDTLPLGYIEAETGALSPFYAGGTAVGSALVLKATTGVGVGAEYIALQVGSNGAMEVGRAVQTSLNTPAIVFGSTTAQTSVAGTLYPQVQSHSIGTMVPYGAYRWTADANGPQMQFMKSRGAAVGTHTIVQTADILGAFNFSGSAGDVFRNGARIQAFSDAGTKSTTSMPGRLSLETTPDTTLTPISRIMTFENGGINIGAGTTTAATTTSPGAGVLALEGTTDATSSTTGILRALGGGSVAKAFWVGTYLATTPTTVAGLPAAAAGNKGARMCVTDSNAASYTAGIGAIVAAGGTTIVPVFSDGTNWRIG